MEEERWGGKEGETREEGEGWGVREVEEWEGGDGVGNEGRPIEELEKNFL